MLNNDTVVVDKDILKILVKTANLYPDAGVFGPKICLYDEPNKIGFSPTYWDKRKCTFILKKYYDYDEVVEIDDIRGCAIFFKREVVEKIGLFDSKFFLVLEETDWCFRAKRAGFKILLVPKIKILHKGLCSFNGVGPLYWYG